MESIQEKMTKAIQEQSFHKVCALVVSKYGLTRAVHLAFDQQMIDAYFLGGPPQADNVDPGVEPELQEGVNQAQVALFKVQHDIWEARDKRYVTNAKNLTEIRELVTLCFDKTMENTIQGADQDLAMVPLRTILTRLRTACTRTNTTTEAELKARLTRKIKEGEMVKDYKADKTIAIRELARMGIRFEENTLYDYLHNGILGEDKVTWSRHPILQIMFMQRYHTRELRTADALCDMLIIHEDQVGNGIKAGDMFAGAAKAKDEAKCYTREEWRKIAEDEETEKERTRNRRGGGNRGGRGGGGGRGDGRGGQGGRAQGRDGRSERRYGVGGGQEHGEYERFCSTHGYNHTHNSTLCGYKCRDHNDVESPTERAIRMPNDRRNSKYY